MLSAEAVQAADDNSNEQMIARGPSSSLSAAMRVLLDGHPTGPIAINNSTPTEDLSKIQEGSFISPFGNKDVRRKVDDVTMVTNWPTIA